MKRVIFILTFVICAVAAGASRAYSVDEVPNVHLQDRMQYVTNPDGILSAATQTRINAMLRALADSTSSEMVVVALDAVRDYEANQFATELFTEWGVGKKDRDNGVLMLIVRDARRVVIRTGRGIEGVLPDIICGRIIRNEMLPAFREGDYDAGTLAAVSTISSIIENPANRDEILSKYPNDAPADDEDFTLADALGTMAAIGGVATVTLLVLLVVQMRTGRRLPVSERYAKIYTLYPIAIFMCFIGLGIPLLALIPIVIAMKRMRRRHAPCPNCGHKMHKLSEAADNAYLTAAQDAEEHLKSVDYDVWLCDNCGTTDVIPFINRTSSYTMCPQCGARACTLVSDRVTLRPRVGHKGAGLRTYMCRNCHQSHSVAYDIAALAAAAPIIGGGGFGGGGGGFSGGSFGGGITGGGGASGGW